MKKYEVIKKSPFTVIWEIYTENSEWNYVTEWKWIDTLSLNSIETNSEYFKEIK